jgi:hypothetical protein
VTISIPLALDLVPLVLSGKKTLTVRPGIRRYPLGPARIVSGNVDIPIEILELEFMKLRDLNQSVAKSEGYATLGEFLSNLRRFYSEAEIDRDVTVVCFRQS